MRMRKSANLGRKHNALFIKLQMYKKLNGKQKYVTRHNMYDLKFSKQSEDGCLLVYQTTHLYNYRYKEVNLLHKGSGDVLHHEFKYWWQHMFVISTTSCIISRQENTKTISGVDSSHLAPCLVSNIDPL